MPMESIRAPWTSGRDNIHEDIGCAAPLWVMLTNKFCFPPERKKQNKTQDSNKNNFIPNQLSQFQDIFWLIALWEDF